MADVRPFPALHYDLARVGSLQDVTAPPYDVIDAGQRAQLLARSPFNVVEIDLPQAGPGEDPYAHAASTLEDWELKGILCQDREPALWALTQEYTVPDGSRHNRHAILARVRVEDYGAGRVRPHERTQPGPKKDRLDLTRATRHNLSPIFSLTSTDAWPRVDSATAGEPWGEVTDDDGTVHRVWRVADPDIHEAVAAELAGAELLIADGHHRYETARAYRDGVGGEGPHCYTLMALTALDDPGLTVFPTHRLLSGLSDDAEKREHLREGLRELFEIEEVGDDDFDPAGEHGLGVFGYVDSHHKQAMRLRLKDTAELDRMLEGRPEAYRRLDVSILETLVLKGILGMSEDDIAEKRGIGYAKSIAEVVASLEGGEYEAAFILRPTPIEQVREVAAAGETMPPKSTYFFPKILSGIVFNPLS
ncbi:MAG: DUF1015 domain-containing protein [Actinomycetota bacterium]|nr:DUF1015 domain-containing protein [Actinomycetota bacterium]